MTFSLLSNWQRVLLTLDYRDTDRVPIAMVCSGINEPARHEPESASPAHRPRPSLVPAPQRS